MDMHYDEVFRSAWEQKAAARREAAALSQDCVEEERVAPRRPHSYHEDPRVLEMRTSGRYETFALPDAVANAFRRPSDEQT